jgi:YD repeat-containing protein
MGGTDRNTRYFTTASYDAQGRKIAEGNGNGDTQTWTYNYYGRLTSSRDLGGAVTTYTYDRLGQLIGQTRAGGVNPGQNFSFEYFENGQQKRVVDNALGTESSYEYDAAGHRTRERFKKISNGEIYQDVRTSYDELGRVSKLVDNRYNQTYSYDAAGNRRRTLSNYFDTANVLKTRDSWYTYDAGDRILIAEGLLVNGAITITADSGSGASLVKGQGTRLYYDGAGNRTIARFYEGTNYIEESYNYDALNRLTNTFRGGQQTSARFYDGAGRVIDYVSYSSPGTIKDRQVSTYNANGWSIKQDVYNSSNVLTQTTRYDYSDSFDWVGNVLKYTVAVHGAYTNTYVKEYAKTSSYRERVVHGSSTYFQAGDTTLNYDVNGNVIRIEDRFNANKNRDHIVNYWGMILQKRENGQTQYYYYADGSPVGSVGDIGGANADFDYNYTPVSDSYPASSPSSYTVNQGDTLKGIALAVWGDARLWYLIADANGLRGDSDLKTGQILTIPNQITNIYNSFETRNVYSPGDIIGSSTPTLPEPPPPPPPPKQKATKRWHRVFKSFNMMMLAPTPENIKEHHAANKDIVKEFSFKEFIKAHHRQAISPSKQNFMAMANSNPGAPAMMGLISENPWILAIIMIVVAFFTAGAALAILGPAFTLLSSAIGAMAGSIASQLVGMAAGLQDGFNWKAVAVAGVTSFITGGIGAISGMGGAAGAASGGLSLASVGSAVAQGAINGIVSQGVNMAFGQQEKFSWRMVAASAVSSGAGSALPGGGGFAGNVGRGLITGAASQAIASKGKVDWKGVAASAIGNAIVGSIQGRMQQAQANSTKPSVDNGTRDDMDGPTAPYDDGMRDDMDTAPVTSPYDDGIRDDMDTGPKTHTVKGGDTFWNIAKGQLGPNASNADIQKQAMALMQANSGVDPRNLKMGQDLNLVGPGEGGDISDATRAAYNKSDGEYQTYRAEKAARQAEAAQANAGRSIMFTGSNGRAGSDSTSFGWLRTAIGYEGVNALYHGAYLRDAYQQLDVDLAARVRAQVGSLPSDLLSEQLAAAKSQIAEAGVETRNANRANIRSMGEPIIDPIAKALRGAKDMPSYEYLRDVAGKSDDQMIATLSKTNSGANTVAKVLTRAGAVGVAADVGFGAYNVVEAPEGEKVVTALEETRRVTGGIAGGIAGAKAGAALGAGIALLTGPFAPVVAPWTAGIGSIAGGVTGAIYGAEYFAKPWW